jgi:hypothetical protein
LKFGLAIFLKRGLHFSLGHFNTASVDNQLEVSYCAPLFLTMWVVQSNDPGLILDRAYRDKKKHFEVEIATWQNAKTRNIRLTVVSVLTFGDGLRARLTRENMALANMVSGAKSYQISVSSLG